MYISANHVQNTLSDVHRLSRKMVKRLLESEQPDDPVDVDRFVKMTRMSKDCPFKIVRTREEVDM